MKLSTFNCQGLLSKYKQQQLASDFNRYNLDFLLLQETHLKNQGVLELRCGDENTKSRLLNLYYCGSSDNKSQHGVGFLVDKSRKVCFKPINDRICTMTTSIDQQRNLVMICAYAPTLTTSNRNPQIRETFYDNLQSVLATARKKDIVILAGDFNAKTGSEYCNFPDVLGKFGKGQVNENGQHFLELCKQNDLKVMNTCFEHKMTHRTTWTCPERIEDHLDARTKEPRRNPYRNQIDYICTKNETAKLVQDARSYGGMTTNSDHKIVIAKMNLRLPRLQYKKSEPSVNYDNIIEKQFEYKNEVNRLMGEKEDTTVTQRKWDNIVDCTSNAAMNILGTKDRNSKKTCDPLVKKLSEDQKKLRRDYEATKSKERRKKLKTERNEKIHQIHKLLKKKRNDEIEEKIAQIENLPNDSRKMFSAIKDINRQKPKVPLLLEMKNGGLTSNDEQQTLIIQDHFEKQFKKNVKPSEIVSKIKPTEMRNPFTEDEVKKAAQRLKNNKSAGKDNIKPELIKYAPDSVFLEIADIINKIAETGEYPEELVQGILCALQKPGKKKGPTDNLRPIVLFSVLRKITAICLADRIKGRINNEIPITQAAYRSGRSTTEHVFAMKILAERASQSKEEIIHIALMDMSKAFDCINRNKLLEDLGTILEHDELFLVKTLLETELSARCGKFYSPYFETDTGAPQGDCMSATEFTYYLAKTLEFTLRSDELESMEDHTYCVSKKNKDVLEINLQYADDISIITNRHEIIEKGKNELPKILGARDLKMNIAKTEEFVISSKGNDKWKKCKFLGSLLGTEEDIQRRKILAQDAIRNLNSYFKNKNLTIKTKRKIFNAYITSIFLYNCELWTLSESNEHKIDAFHRRLLRTTILNIKWPKKMSNDKVYEITKETKWSKIIKQRRISWLGHLLRLDNETPAKKALDYTLNTQMKRKRGRPKLDWISMINKQLLNSDMTFENAKIMAHDKLYWRRFEYAMQ